MLGVLVTGSPVDVVLYDKFTVKAGNDFALYQVPLPGIANKAGWDTKLLDNKDLSHLSFWSVADEVTSPAPVPEPGTVGLAAAGFGLLALGARRRGQRKQ